jgi:hypothetical protein
VLVGGFSAEIKFGHVLRMNENVPSRQAITFYFSVKSHKGRDGTFCTIASQTVTSVIFLMSIIKGVFQKSIN